MNPKKPLAVNVRTLSNINNDNSITKTKPELFTAGVNNNITVVSVV